VVVDQILKFWIVATYEPYKIYPIVGDWLEIDFIHNAGGLFGIFQGSAPVFAVVTVAVVGLIGYMEFRWGWRSWLMTVALGLLLAGAVGNLIDRIRLGYVVDFTDIGIGTLRWYVFNVADMAVTCFFITVIVMWLFFPRLLGGGDLAASETAGPKTAAPEIAGSESTGSGIPGPEAGGSEVAGPVVVPPTPAATKPAALKPAGPKPAAPTTAARKTAAKAAAAPTPAAPKSAAPAPVAPKPAAAKPPTPTPAARKTSGPKSAAAAPATPKAAGAQAPGPKPAATKPAATKPAAPKPAGSDARKGPVRE
jgi:lipoprotein signal peptidase